MRYFLASIVALSCATAALAAAGANLDGQPTRRLVAELASDGVRLNGQRAYRELLRRVSRSAGDGDEVRALLEARLETADRQFRQVASLLLVGIYERYEVPAGEWPEEVIVNLVDGLPHDELSGGRLVANAAHALGALYEMSSRRPIEALRRRLLDEDPQGRFAVATVLAHYLTGVEPEVSDVLVAQLRDDGRPLNEMAAFQGLVGLGAVNLGDVLARVEPVDWQQAGLLQCAASLLGVEWRAPERFVDEWLERSHESARGRIVTAALYLHPDIRRIAREHEPSRLLARLLHLGPRSGGPEARARWAGGWFWFLELERDGAWLSRTALLLY